jgi:hypothetical protein
VQRIGRRADWIAARMSENGAHEDNG